MQAAWPDITIEGGEAAFLQYVESRRHPGAILSSLHAEDLYLTYACAHGCEAALRAFDRRYLSQVDHFVPPGDRSPAFLDELRQVLRDKLLVGRDGAPPKIAGYSGRGSLQSWVRTAAVHAARNLHRSRGSDPLRQGDEGAVNSLTDAQEPELRYLKQKYRQEFKEALQAAFGSLPFEQREVVRLHYVDGLNIDKIGDLLGVNRATVARWRVAAQQALLAATQRQLHQRLKLSKTEFSSLARLVQSQLDVSLARLLRPGSGREDS